MYDLLACSQGQAVFQKTLALDLLEDQTLLGLQDCILPVNGKGPGNCEKKAASNVEPEFICVVRVFQISD